MPTTQLLAVAQPARRQLGCFRKIARPTAVSALMATALQRPARVRPLSSLALTTLPPSNCRRPGATPAQAAIPRRAPSLVLRCDGRGPHLQRRREGEEALRRGQEQLQEEVHQGRSRLIDGMRASLPAVRYRGPRLVCRHAHGDIAWLSAHSPHRADRASSCTAYRLRAVSVSPSAMQIPCRHGTPSIPHQMPDIRLQVQPTVPSNDLSVAGLGGGVHIREARARMWHGALRESVLR